MDKYTLIIFRFLPALAKSALQTTMEGIGISKTLQTQSCKSNLNIGMQLTPSIHPQLSSCRLAMNVIILISEISGRPNSPEWTAPGEVKARGRTHLASAHVAS